MISTSFLSYVLLHLLYFSEGAFLDFFRHLDVRLLDDTDFCEVVTNLPHFHDDDWFADLSGGQKSKVELVRKVRFFPHFNKCS